jgi:hypothetical protein
MALLQSTPCLLEGKQLRFGDYEQTTAKKRT